MLVAGVDVGAATAKTAIVENGELLAYAVMPTGDFVGQAAHDVTVKALQNCGHTMEDLDYVCSTGYARRVVDFADKAISEIICHARGVHATCPDVRTIIDIGGQDSKVINVRPDGTVGDFIMNDKCAAGTGRFLEVMADVLKLTIDEMGPVSLTSENPSNISSTCTIFAETEVVSLRADKTPKADMVAGIHRAVARRVWIMGRNVGYRDQIAFTGGVAKNSGVVHFMEEFVHSPIIIPQPPQIMGALGAALLASARIGRKLTREEKSKQSGLSNAVENYSGEAG